MRLSIITCLLVLLVRHADGTVTHMAKCDAERLDVCEPVVITNTYEACNVSPHEDLPSGRKGVEPSKAPLGHFLLKMLRWLCPKKSWIDDQMRKGADFDASDLLKPSLIGYSPVAAISIILAIILFFFLLGFLLPVLWCRCTRSCCFAGERPRTKRTTVIVCFSVLLALACLFYYGAMWYSFWAADDLKATSCTVAGVSRQVLYEDIHTSSNGRFKGLYSLTNDVESSSDTLVEFSDKKGLQDLSSLDFVLRAFMSAFAPLLWTSQMLNAREFKGWAAKPGSETVADTFQLNLVAAVHPKWQSQPESAADPSQFTVKWVKAYGPLLKALGSVEALRTNKPFATDTAAGKALVDAQSQFASLNQNMKDWTSSIFSYYNKMIQYIKDANPERKEVKAGTIVTIVISAVTILGGIAAAIIFAHYIRTDQHLNPLHRPGHKMTRFAGFMAFGYIFWAIILLLLGGILMFVAYWPSDICNVVGTKMIEEGRWEDYEKKYSVDKDVRDACLTPDSDGDLLKRRVHQENIDKMKDFTIPGLEELDSVTLPALDLAELNAFVESEDFAGMTLIFGDMTPKPLNGPGRPTDHQLRTAVPEKTGFKCAETDIASVKAVCSAGGMASIIASDYGTDRDPVDITGLDDLPSIVINKFLADMPNKPSTLCMTRQCPNNVPKVNTNTVPNRVGTEWKDEVKDLYTSTDALLQAASDYVISTNSEKTPEVIYDWFETLRHLVRLNLLDSDFYRSSKSELPESILWVEFANGIVDSDVTFPKGISDPCTIGTACPIFYALVDRSDISKGYKLVNYSTWKANVKEDTKAAIQQLTQTTDIIAYVKNRAAKQTSVESISSQYETVSSNYNCRALRSVAQTIRTRVCENVAADLASISIFWFLLGLCHIFAFVMVFMYWLARRREGETAKDDEEEVVQEAAAVNERKYRHTRGDFLQAAEHGDYPVVKECAEDYDADTVFDPDYHNSPLHLAAYYGHIDCVRELLARGWSPNELNFHHYTPTTACVTNHNLPFETKSVVVTDLVNAGGKLDIFDHYGNTSLMIATRANERELVELLVKLGADPDVEDDYHVDSLQLAQSFGHSEVFDILSEASPRRSMNQGPSMG